MRMVVEGRGIMRHRFEKMELHLDLALMSSYYQWLVCFDNDMDYVSNL
jgi:hypothetical protein